MKRTAELVGSLVLGFIAGLTAGGCVIEKAPAQPAPTAASAPAATPSATTAAAPPSTPADDPNAEIPTDSDEPTAVSDPTPTQPAWEEPPKTEGKAEDMALGIVEGKPKGLEPGAPAAFWIWRNAQGIWKVRTTTAKKLHEFRGRVEGVQKPIGKVKPSRLEYGDHIRRGAQHEIIFKFATKGNIDGFDFRAPAGTCIRFDLMLDRGATAKRVFIGKNAVSPKTNHFILCNQPANAQAATVP
jgi:hypothetical protein